MSLRFDRRIPDTLRVKVLLFPGFDSFGSGALHGLFGALNADEELFNHVLIRKEPSAKFDGEEWAYHIGEKHVTIEVSGGATDDFATRVQTLLEATRKHFKERRELRGMRFFVLDKVLLSALVPEDKHKDVGTIVKTKALGRIKGEHYSLLPGEVRGAAIHLLGETDQYEWNVTVAPSLARPDDLYVSADVEFPAPSDEQAVKALQEGGDIALVVGGIKVAADFLRDHAMLFAQGVLPENKPRKKGSDDDE